MTVHTPETTADVTISASAPDGSEHFKPATEKAESTA